MHKQLKCPHCDRRVIDSGENVRSEIRVIRPTDSWKADYFTKCWGCKNEIGIKQLNIPRT